MTTEKISLYILIGLIVITCVRIVVSELNKVKRNKQNILDILKFKARCDLKEIEHYQTNIYLKDIILARLYVFGRFKYVKDKKTGKTKYAFAYVTKRNIRKELRKSISHIKPEGWQRNVDKQIYNRCHLIASILGGEDSKKNLITATRKLNELMIPYEYKVQKYVSTNNKPVIYKVTPVYVNKNVLCKGIMIEAYSVFDKGRSIQFNVFIPNKQNDVKINYKKGNYEINKLSLAIKSINSKKVNTKISATNSLSKK